MFNGIRESRRRLLIVFFSLSCLILIITIGFAALSTALNINVSSITQTVQDWDIGFVPETVTPEVGGTSSVGRNCPTATSTKTSITFGEISLSKPGDSCTYEFTVENNGTIDGDLDSILFSDPLEETCTGDASSKTCGNITYELYKGDSPLTTSDGYLCADDSYKVKVIIRNSGNSLASSEITQSNGRYTLTFVQSSSGACGSAQPFDPDDPTGHSLYNVLKGEATTGTYAKEYTGPHQDTMAGAGTKKIYHWWAADTYLNPLVNDIQDKNNVIFAGFCWKMIRTTDTGGVKILYNGEPNNGQCNNSGEDTVIGRSPYNSNYDSPAYVGYMYNPSTLITFGENEAATSGSLFGNGVTYSGGKYHLTNTSTTYDDNHHYTCNNTTGTCSTVRYYHYNNCYVEISDGRTIEEALEDMLSADNVNRINSNVKQKIDEWYDLYMTEYTEALEDTIFCNDRSISNIGGWNPNGGSKNENLHFKNYGSNANLSCPNITDRFSMSNNKAHLPFPVGLLTWPETVLLNNRDLNKTDFEYWINAPFNFYCNYSNHWGIDNYGNISEDNVDFSSGVRPVVSLKTNTEYSSGDGSKNNPYRIASEH